MEEITEIVSELIVARTLSSETSEGHIDLLEKYESIDYSFAENDERSSQLMSYNGYYSLDTAPGAFFTVDTNMVVTKGQPSPIFDISLIISLDGKTSSIYPFSSNEGTFNENRLQFNPSGVNLELPVIDLVFTRGNKGDGVTATVFGTIQMPQSSSVIVLGTTYNNIIPMSMYAGEYYEDILDIWEDPIMIIGADNSLQYKENKLFAKMVNIDSFIYNMNMYFFSFKLDGDVVKLIMGTSAGGGMVCNNMIVPPGKDAKLQTRMLKTAKTGKKWTSTELNGNSKALANFGGFYQIKSSTSETIQPGAFISVEGLYKVASKGAAPIYTVNIGISLDSKNSEVYTIDTSMTFENDTLSIPATSAGEQEITIHFIREYIQGSKGEFGSLVSISGTINGADFTGTTLLNPVPLSAFGGSALTALSPSTEKLVINSDTEIVYNGITYDTLLYVPVMYILAFTVVPKNTVVLSLGTDGGKGTACIVTNDAASLSPLITSVFGIPSGKSGQANVPSN